MNARVALPRVATMFAVACSVVACSRPEPAPSAPLVTSSAPAPAPVATTPEAPPSPAPVADRWVGRWTGPEGTYLDVAAPVDGSYAIQISNLDGPRPFTAHAVGDHLELERDGRQLTISATDGPGTGMKWLQDKQDCVVIAPGEGFCR